jgi:2-polyprenyl-3-methyl-5-hydroxy-6-metoxy-1,4-benzoquinol methylase
MYQEYGYADDHGTEAHQYLLPAVMKHLKRCGAKNVLDAGCGNGSFDRRLMEAGYHVYGVDASEEGIRHARKYAADRFFVMDFSSDPWPEPIENAEIDTIVSTEVIEHLYDPKHYLRRCRDILGNNPDGGHLIVSTPYHGYLKNLAIALAGKFDKHFTVLWDGGHIKFWSKKTLTRALEDAGFEVVGFTGAGRLPWLWKSMVIQARVK